MTSTLSDAALEKRVRECMALSACGPERSVGPAEVIGCQVHDNKVLAHNFSTLLCAVRDEAVQSRFNDLIGFPVLHNGKPLPPPAPVKED